MSALAGWAVEALIASALLMALVLMVRGPVRRAFGPQVAYALWALPLLRLVLPPLPATWRYAAATPIGRAGETVIVVLSPAVAAPAAAPMPLALLVTVLIAAWAIGAVGFLGYHVVRHARFCRRIVAAAERIGRDGSIRIVTSAAAPGPLAFGIWRRYVAFPVDVADRYDADERALALAHELGHHRRGDLAANWAALVVLALHWFNPLAWRAFHAFRADQELANDARVLAGRSPGERQVYARAIVKAAYRGELSPACHFHTITDLKGRLKMLSLSPASRRRLASGGAAVAALAVAGLGLTASGSSAAAIGAGVKEAVAQVAPPAPPAPLEAVVPPAPMSASKNSTSTSMVTSDRGGRKVKRVVIVKDGKTNSYEGEDADAYLAANPMPVVPVQPVSGEVDHVSRWDDVNGRMVVDPSKIPAVVTLDCPPSKKDDVVVHDKKAGRQMIVICNNRIRLATADAMVTASNAKDIERTAYVRALAGLIDARARMAANADTTEADRTRALTAIDQSIIEMRGQLARFH